MKAAVARVAEITVGASELASYNGSLAAALKQQSTSVRQIAVSVQETATQIDRITDEVQSLDRLSHAS